MPALDDEYRWSSWLKTHSCWTGDDLIDRLHEKSVQRALRRIWPDDIDVFVDAGCGDGKVTGWIAVEFAADAFGVDVVKYPGVEEHCMYVAGDAEDLERLFADNRPVDLVMFCGALTHVEDWTAAVRGATQVAGRVLVIDNLHPATRKWWADWRRPDGKPVRRPIDRDDLVREMEGRGFVLVNEVAVDWLHRKLFLYMPRVLRPAVAALTHVVDTVAAYVMPPRLARHRAMLFEELA